MGLVFRIYSRNGCSNKLILEDEILKRLNKKLLELETKGRSIKVAIAGCGLMGTGLVSQLTLVKGMRPALVVDRTIEKILRAFKLAKVQDDMVEVCQTLEEINKALDNNKYVACNNMDLLTKANIDIVVDATGNPEAGAEIALAAIDNHKDLVLLNVELDSTVGPILYEKAREKGLVYTGTAGDEPGSAKEILDFAEILGFEVLAIGKGKNNKIDYGANEDTVRAEAESKNLKPAMLAGFVDGTNTMIELTVMANATGFKPDVRGCHGLESNVDDLPKKLSLKSQGGILNSYKVVEYVNGIAPGVFAIVTGKLPQVHSEMKFLKMGDGPNYILYRPYHLTSLETPITIARAIIDREATIAPDFGQVCDTVTVAKKDLEVGDYLDTIGKYTVYGTIESHERARKENLVPIGLINSRTKVLKPIKKGQLITRDAVEIDKSTSLYKLREDQEKKGL